MDDLPVKGRQFVDLALLAPGVTVDTASANSATDSISFGGFNEQFKSLWLEGIDINDEVTGGGSGLSNASRHTFSQESVQEFQIVANQYSVEFGRSGSGVINILTKSGSNRLAGRGYYFLRDDAFDKPNAFATGKVPFRQQQFGATLAGPIVRDRVHYFASYERQIYDDVVTVNIPAFVLPIITDPRTEVPRPLRQHNFFGKLTATMSPRHYLSATGNVRQPGSAGAGSGRQHRRRRRLRRKGARRVSRRRGHVGVHEQLHQSIACGLQRRRERSVSIRRAGPTHHLPEHLVRTGHQLSADPPADQLHRDEHDEPASRRLGRDARLQGRLRSECQPRAADHQHRFQRRVPVHC